MTERKTVLVTGASGGIGYELAKIFAANGFDLVLVARQKDKLEKLAAEFRSQGVSARVLAKDLSRPASPKEIFEEISNASVSIDILVNNAGVGVYGNFADTDLNRELELLQLNMVSLTHLTKLFLPGMIRRRSGKILNVASTAAFQPGPLMAVYFASKAYVLSFSEAVRNELKGTGVTLSLLCPGPTESDFQQVAGIDRQIKLFKLSMMNAQSVAQTAYEGLMKNKGLIVPGFVNKVGIFSLRLSPRPLTTAIVRYLQEGKRQK